MIKLLNGTWEVMPAVHSGLQGGLKLRKCFPDIILCTIHVWYADLHFVDVYGNSKHTIHGGYGHVGRCVVCPLYRFGNHCHGVSTSLQRTHLELCRHLGLKVTDPATGNPIWCFHVDSQESILWISPWIYIYIESYYSIYYFFILQLHQCKTWRSMTEYASVPFEKFKTCFEIYALSMKKQKDALLSPRPVHDFLDACGITLQRFACRSTINPVLGASLRNCPQWQTMISNL